MLLLFKGILLLYTVLVRSTIFSSKGCFINRSIQQRKKPKHSKSPESKSWFNFCCSKFVGTDLFFNGFYRRKDWNHGLNHILIPFALRFMYTWQLRASFPQLNIGQTVTAFPNGRKCIIEMPLNDITPWYIQDMNSQIPFSLHTAFWFQFLFSSWPEIFTFISGTEFASHPMSN